MEIRKNNDIKFKLTLVDNNGDIVTNIKDVKCTLVNNGLIGPHYHNHIKMFHSVMCAYNNTYNVLPVNCYDYCEPFREDQAHKLGTEVLPVMVNNTQGKVDAYFAANRQVVLGAYKMILEIQCWDPTWADKGIHTHTVQIDNVCKLTDGENNGSTSPCIIEILVVVPHGTTAAIGPNPDPEPEPEPDPQPQPSVYAWWGTYEDPEDVTVSKIGSGASRVTSTIHIPSAYFYIIYPTTVAIELSQYNNEIVTLAKNGHATGPAASEVVDYTVRPQSYNGTEYWIAWFDSARLEDADVTVKFK